MKKYLLLVISTLLFEIAVSQIRWDPLYFEPVFSVTEFQPQVQWNGRINTIAVNPDNNSEIVVASESGGLFRSSNGGANWVHLDNLPSFNVNDVIFYPGSSGLLFATTWKNMKANNGGGIWKSDDGGDHWTRCVIPSTYSGDCSGSFSAYGISIEPVTGKIFVATDCGVAFSDSRGGFWSHTGIGGAGTVVSIVALGGNRVIAGGTSGVYFANDGVFGSASWSRTTSTAIGPLAEGNDYGAIKSLHALCRTSHAEFISGGAIAFAINPKNELFYSMDGGSAWTEIDFPHSGNDVCGGINFIKAIRTGDFTAGNLDLYVSNRCKIYKLTCPRITGTNSFDYSNGPTALRLWIEVRQEHDDTRDLGFTGIIHPKFMATDGGLATLSVDGRSWLYLGSGARHGLNALQITEVTGQQILSPSRYDLYFATQDNDLWFSPNTGRSWYRGARAEGFYFDMLRRAPAETDSKLTYIAGSGNSREISDPHFANAATWPNAPNGYAHAVIIQKGIYIQLQDRAAPTAVLIERLRRSDGDTRLRVNPVTLGITKNAGANWHTILSIPENTRGRPVFVGSASNPVIYQGIKIGYNIAKGYDSVHLVRATNFLTGAGASAVLSAGTATYPLMRNFGGIGVFPTMFAWYEVYAVDPADPSHIIATDVFNGTMKTSVNGGDDWTDMPELTALVTENGNLRFSREERICEVSHISFFPDYPQYVMVGTSEAGLFYSQDGGVTWREVPGSKQIPNITSIHWITESRLVISSYGRGLWKVNIHFLPLARAMGSIRADDFSSAAITVVKQPEIGSQKADLDNAFMVVNGYITDMGLNDKKELAGLTVSPGGFLMQVNGKGNQLPPGVTIDAGQKFGSFTGLESCLALVNQKKILNGFKLTNGRLIEIIYSNTIIKLEFPKKVPGKFSTQGLKEFPITDKPYLMALSKNSISKDVYERKETVQLVGQNYLDDPRKPIEVMLDGKVINQNVNAEGGVFSIDLILDLPIGIHNITARQSTGPNSVLIDNLSFIIKHKDGDQGFKEKGSLKN